MTSTAPETTPIGAPRQPPIWLCDVDGVLNALACQPDFHRWNDWQLIQARAASGTYRIWYSPTMTALLAAWHHQHLIDLRWLSTWAHDANTELAPAFGLPQLHVQASPPPRHLAPSHSEGHPDTDLHPHANTAGARRDHLTGRWWKFDAVRELALHHPQRPIIWADDDLAYEPDIIEWMATHTTSLLLIPNPTQGLGPDHMGAAYAFITQHTR